jgi:hypothetical protein
MRAFRLAYPVSSANISRPVPSYPRGGIVAFHATAFAAGIVP